jgi:hypothetical protein
MSIGVSFIEISVHDGWRRDEVDSRPARYNAEGRFRRLAAARPDDQIAAHLVF